MTIIMDLSFINWNTVYYYFALTIYVKKITKIITLKKMDLLLSLLLNKGLHFFVGRRNLKEEF